MIYCFTCSLSFSQNHNYTRHCKEKNKKEEKREIKYMRFAYIFPDWYKTYFCRILPDVTRRPTAKEVIYNHDVLEFEDLNISVYSNRKRKRA